MRLLGLAPSVNVLGSFFPIWIVFIVAGVLLTLGARLLLVRVGLEEELGPLVIVYPAMVVLLSCAMWLAWFQL
jgi:hypothetical protein